MQFFHYNPKKYDTLLTKELQGVVSPEEAEQGRVAAEFRGDPGPYYEHVSFLLHPAPLDFIGAVFPPEHHTWGMGKELVEHVVELDDLDIYAWRIVEGPVSMFFLEHIPWHDNPWYKRAWFGARNVARKLFREEGTDLRSLKKALSKIHPDTTRDSYAALLSRPDYDDIKDKYAATVPHLMVYTKEPIKVSKHNDVKVNGNPVPGMESKETYPNAIPAKGYNGLYVIPGLKNYLANKKGEIYNITTKNKTKGSLEGRYLKVYIRDKPTDKPKLRYTHDLVCRAFHGNPPQPGMVVGHKNGIKADVNASNLEWQTQKDNVKHAYRTGLKPSAKWK